MKTTSTRHSFSKTMTVVAGCLLGGIGAIGYSCAPKEEVHAERASPSTTGSERCFSADLKGPVMVEVPAKGGTVTYCIDSTEVTLGQYKAFVNDVGDDFSWQDQRCVGQNSSYTPTPLVKPEPNAEVLPQWDQADEMPVNWVDWCDATAYCKWAGKRLCGRLSSGGVDNPAIFNEDGQAILSGDDINQWYNACTQQETTLYSTGDACDETMCANWYAAPPSYERNENCHGNVPPFDQVFDLSGSVEEWVDECAKNNCLALSGARSETDGKAFRCDEVEMRGFTAQSYKVGIRCCKD